MNLVNGSKLAEGNGARSQAVSPPPLLLSLIHIQMCIRDRDNVVEVVNNLHKRFFSEWLPTAEYEQVNGMNFEIYGGDSDMGYVELWYAVKKKVQQT